MPARTGHTTLGEEIIKRVGTDQAAAIEARIEQVYRARRAGIHGPDDQVKTVLIQRAQGEAIEQVLRHEYHLDPYDTDQPWY
jgi:hypothetical protein